uniref:Uncharacterized protein n=1 Tax=Haemonchus contortus TaxID=6289 RepID=A0A7I4YYJ3_HAECO
MMHVSLILKNNILWFMVVVHIPLAGSMRCLIDEGQEGHPMISSEDFPSCEVYFYFERKGGQIFGKRLNYGGGDTTLKRSNMDSVSCDIYGGDNELIGQENREETLANMKGGLVNCFCDTSIICATNYSTFEKFFSEASPQEKQFYDPFKNIGVPKAEELLAEYMANTTTINATSYGITEAYRRVATDASGGFPVITVVLILGGIFVTLILVSVLATLLWKVHKYQYKKKLERTWEERVRQAGLELEKQEQEAKMKKLEDSKELEQKEKSIDESKEPMGSLEITNSKERLSNEPANGPSADPFGDFIAKVDTGNAPPQPPPGTQ